VQTFLLLVYVASWVRDHDDVRFVATILVGSLLLESLASFAFAKLGPSFHFAGIASHTDAAAAGDSGRFGGTVGSPNTAASFFSLILPLALSMLATSRSKLVRRLSIAAFACGSLALVLTFSRGGWLAFAISTTLTVVVAVRRGWLKAPPLALIIGAALALGPFVGEIAARLSGSDQGSAGARIPLMEIAWRIIQAHPLGVGLNNYALYIHDFVGPSMDGTWLYVVHDKYLLVWAECGPLALLAFLWFLASTIRNGWRATRTSDQMLGPIALGLVAGVIGQLAHMSVDIFQSRPQVQLLWFVAGFLLAVGAIEREGVRA
jgi:O-antigen ligase